MKLVSPNTELKVIRTICSGDDKWANMTFARVDESYFYYDPCQEAYNRINSVVRATGEIPSYSELCNDPAISEESRAILTANEQKAARSHKSFTGIVENLSTYRKARLLYETAEKTIKAMRAEKLSIEEILDHNTTALAQARAANSVNEEIFHFGKGNNSTGLVKRLLSNEAPPVIPTGFEVFDKENGGFFRGSLVTIGASTGGGKCLVGSSLVTCANNVKVPIEDLWSWSTGLEVAYKGGIRKDLLTPFHIMKHDGSTAEVTCMYKTSGETLKLTFEDGRVLEGLPEHKVKCQTATGYVFKRLDELTLDDDIVIS